MDSKSDYASVCKLEPEESFPSPLLLAFLTFSVVLESYRSIEKPAALAFVVISHLDLMLLFWCFSKLDNLPFNSARWKHLKVAVWFLSTILIAMVTYYVATIMPLAVKVLIWSVAVLTMSVTFYACFLNRDDSHGVPIENSLDGKLLPLLSKGHKFVSSQNLASGLINIMV